MDGVLPESESVQVDYIGGNWTLCGLGPGRRVQIPEETILVTDSTNYYSSEGKASSVEVVQFSSRMGERFLYFKCYSSALLDECFSIVLQL